MCASIRRSSLVLGVILSLLIVGGVNHAAACGGSCGGAGAAASGGGGGNAPPTIPVVTPAAVSPVIAKEAQYGRNLPGELVTHFTEYVWDGHGDLYFGVFTTSGK